MLMCLPQLSQAQQDFSLTQFSRNRVFFNPAAAAGEQARIESAAQQQWLMLSDRTGTFNTWDQPASGRITPNIGASTMAAHLTVPVYSGGCKCESRRVGGLMAGAARDQLGYEENRMLWLGSAYSLPLAGHITLNTGFSYMLHAKSFRTEDLRALINPDPLIPAGQNPSDIRSNLSAGAEIQFDRTTPFWLGFSVTGLLPREFTYANLGGGTTRIATARHYYLSGGWNIRRSNWQVEPVWLIRSAQGRGGLVYPQIDVQTTVTWKSQFSAGAGIRAQAGSRLAGMESLQGMLAFVPAAGQGRFRISYAYDLTLQSLRKNSAGTHALQLSIIPGNRLRIKLKKECGLVDHPRRLDKHPYFYQ